MIADGSSDSSATSGVLTFIGLTPGAVIIARAGLTGSTRGFEIGVFWTPAMSSRRTGGALIARWPSGPSATLSFRASPRDGVVAAGSTVGGLIIAEGSLFATLRPPAGSTPFRC